MSTEAWRSTPHTAAGGPGYARWVDLGSTDETVLRESLDDLRLLDWLDAAGGRFLVVHIPAASPHRTNSPHGPRRSPAA
ncbi:MAG: hypothetical protein U0790_13500 [Isosphaeraceae bacterium]